MNPQTWVASGHLGGFSDPLMDCRECHERFRADKLIEDYCAKTGEELPKPIDACSQAEMKSFIDEKNICCPTCGKHNFTDIRQFNLMFKTFQGVTEDAKNDRVSPPGDGAGHLCELRQRAAHHAPASCRSASARSASRSATRSHRATSLSARVNSSRWSWSSSASRARTSSGLPTGSGFCKQWLLSLGMKEENLRLRDHDPEELCFYSKATTDFEFLFPFGWGELWGVADRTDYDLTQHQNTSGKDLTYFDQEKNDALYPLCHRAVPRRRTLVPGLPGRCLRRRGRRAGQEGQRRHPHRPASAPGPCAVQGGRPAAVEEALPGCRGNLP